ncbi:hypothetical protein WCE55_13065 [Luteimonas sp. MJ293]|uniref:hypothetical protein n=1 Tax=Luteimonas sp. MJ146 TaxID=3129240 RepID=UPI0031BAED2E
MGKINFRTVIGTVFLLALAGGSIYVFPSGLPQPADFLWVFWLVLVFAWLASRPRRLSSRRLAVAIRVVWLLVLWVVIVSLVHAVLNVDLSFLRHPLFYIFNAAIFSAVMLLGDRGGEKFSVQVSNSVIAAFAVMLAGLAINFEGSLSRQTGGFNNPNQLGYFSLLLCAIFVLVGSTSVVWSLRGAFVFAATLVCVGFSASLTTMASVLPLFVAAALKVDRLSMLLRAGGVAAGVCVLGLPILLMTSLGESLNRTLQSRLGLLGMKSDNVVESRGYDRILDNPEYVVFGAGEGGLWRFGFEHQLEIHSSWGTMLFSYGVLGFVLFIALLIVLLRGRPLWVWLVVLAPSLYGLTHQGLRTTALWVLLACVGWGVSSRSRTRESKRC